MQTPTRALFAALSMGCGSPDWPESRDHGSVASALEPERPLDDAGAAVRLRLGGATWQASSPPLLFSGALTRSEANRVRDGALSSALEERLLPLQYWSEGAELVLQATSILGAGPYTLAASRSGLLAAFDVGAAAPAPLERRFPPHGAPGQRLALYCGTGRAAPDTRDVQLMPGHVPYRLETTLADTPLEDCWALRGAGDSSTALVPPPFVAGQWLDPAPLLPPRNAVVPAPCDSGSVEVPGGCLQMADDRLSLEARGEAVLWALASPVRAVHTAAAGERVEVRGLEPERDVEISGTAFDALGRAEPFSVTVRTAARRRHLVLNEVLANPLGPEASGEWVELANDSDADVSLAGLYLEDSGGAVELPEVSVGPRGFALVVDDSFAPASVDVAPAPGTVIVRVPELGARGLANGGEALLLVGREGVLSSFPARPAASAGVSFARRTPGAQRVRDFGPHAAPGASPGADNRLAE